LKSPAELRLKLRRQWQLADQRELRLLGDCCWPLRLAIGEPAAQQFKNSSALLREQVKNWRDETTGLVEWQSKKYQSAITAVEIPFYWCIRSSNEWVAACQDKKISREYAFITSVLAQLERPFHSLLVRQRSLWRNVSQQQVVQCCQLAMQLQAGCAQGRPLRALSINNIDSKFIENNRTLLTKLLNIRFNNAIKNTSLEAFLGATLENDHWLLVKPLSKGLLPFQQLRLKASELAEVKLPCSHIVVVENEQCRYQLPELQNTIAILGAGLNLNWLSNPHFKSSRIAYWGNIDSWGLKMLSTARNLQPDLAALLMDSETFENNQHRAVIEPQTAGQQTPQHLNSAEATLYQKLLRLEKGRLEQEFIEKKEVQAAIINWCQKG